MAGIKFYDKNLIDLDSENVTITVTDSTADNNGQDFVDFMRNRKNTSAWRTTGSNDAANTQLDINLGDERSIDRIILVDNNFDSYTIQYFNGSSYVDFSTAINVSGNTSTTIEHTFDSVSVSLIRIIITGTIVADSDKSLAQLIITSLLGQLKGFPQIRKPTISREKKTLNMLSGKKHIIRQVGSFSCDLKAITISDNDDLALIEEIYFKNDGVLMWINGGDDTQFNRTNIGFRAKDIYLVSPADEYEPEHFEFVYSFGTKLDMKLVEVV